MMYVGCKRRELVLSQGRSTLIPVDPTTCLFYAASDVREARSHDQ